MEHGNVDADTHTHALTHTGEGQHITHRGNGVRPRLWGRSMYSRSQAMLMIGIMKCWVRQHVRGLPSRIWRRMP